MVALGPMISWELRRRMGVLTPNTAQRASRLFLLAGIILMFGLPYIGVVAALQASPFIVSGGISLATWNEPLSVGRTVAIGLCFLLPILLFFRVGVPTVRDALQLYKEAAEKTPQA